MFFSYTLSVLLLSFSIYGAWCFIHDLWKWWLEPKLVPRPSGSFLVVVRNLDGDIEDLLRYLARAIAYAEVDWDIVVVDVSSNDFTPVILERLATDNECIQVMVLAAGQRALGEAIPLCRGQVVHVLDLSNRLTTEDFMMAVCGLLRQDSGAGLIRRVAK